MVGNGAITTQSRTSRQVEIPRIKEPLGGFIFVCNDETMSEDFERRLFGLPRNYIESVRGIHKGLPLFLYNYSTRLLHGVFEASSDGGLNLEPDAWENKDPKSGGERGTSKYPAQVRVRIWDLKPPLEEDNFRPFVHHYDGKKFRLELTHAETAALLKLFGVGARHESSDCSDSEWEKVRGRTKTNRPVLRVDSPKKRVSNGFIDHHEGRADVAAQWSLGGESPSCSKEDGVEYGVECSSSSRGSYVAALKTGMPPMTLLDRDKHENKNGNHRLGSEAAILNRLHDPDPAVNSTPLYGARSQQRQEVTGKHRKPFYEIRKNKEDSSRKQVPPLIQVHPFFGPVPIISPGRLPFYPVDMESFGYRPVQRNALDADIASFQNHTAWSPQQPVMLVGPPAFSLPSPALAANVESNFEQLHAEILEFARTARPSPPARARAEAAVECVRQGVKQLWPSADVEVFGSFATGLCLPHSDVDVAVLDPPMPELTADGPRGFIPLIRNLATEFKVQKWCESLMTIETASMPVIKLRCKPSAGAPSVAIDVTIGGKSGPFRASKGKRRLPGKFIHNGAAAREYVIEKLRQLPALAPLVLLMKSYLHHKGLNDVYTGGLGSFSLTLMLVFYLEQVPLSWSSPPGTTPVAPSSDASATSSLSELSDSDDEANLTDSTSTTSDEGSTRVTSQQEALITRAWRIVDELLASLQSRGAPNLGSLLIGFLHIFGQEFDFSRARIVLKGANGTSSGGMFAVEPSFQPTSLWIDDPLRPGMNVGAGSFAMCNVQVAMREMLFVLAKPQAGPSLPVNSKQQQKRSLPHLDQLFTVDS